jgi:serine/threonine protein phosphatase PrpC
MGVIEMPLEVETHFKSVPGSVHDYEDRVLADDERRIYAVADGVTISSQGSGAVAAELGLRLLKEVFSYDLSVAVTEVHNRLLSMKETDRTVGETTLTVAHLVGNGVEIVNVGDSPGYLLRDNDLLVLTHADRSELGYITQVLGYPEKIRVHSRTVGLKANDYLILASDGAAHVINHATLLPIVRAAPSSRELAEAIIERAEGTWVGYDDDKSVIVIRVLNVTA